MILHEKSGQFSLQLNHPGVILCILFILSHKLFKTLTKGLRFNEINQFLLLYQRHSQDNFFLFLSFIFLNLECMLVKIRTTGRICCHCLYLSTNLHTICFSTISINVNEVKKAGKKDVLMLLWK